MAMVVGGPVLPPVSGSGSISRVARVLAILTVLVTIALSPVYFLDLSGGLLLFTAVPLLVGAYALWTTDDFYAGYRWLIAALVPLFAAAGLGLVALAFWLGARAGSETDAAFQLLWAIGTLAALAVGVLLVADAGVLLWRFRRARLKARAREQVQTGALRLFGVLMGGMTLLVMNPGLHLSLQSFAAWVSAALIWAVLCPSDAFYRRYPWLVVAGFAIGVVVLVYANGIETAPYALTTRFHLALVPWLVVDAIILFIRLNSARRGTTEPRQINN